MTSVFFCIKLDSHLMVGGTFCAREYKITDGIKCGLRECRRLWPPAGSILWREQPRVGSGSAFARCQSCCCCCWWLWHGPVNLSLASCQTARASERVSEPAACRERAVARSVNDTQKATDAFDILHLAHAKRQRAFALPPRIYTHILQCARKMYAKWVKVYARLCALCRVEKSHDGNVDTSR